MIVRRTLAAWALLVIASGAGAAWRSDGSKPGIRRRDQRLGRADGQTWYYRITATNACGEESSE